MKILVISQYFWPETFIINDLVLHLHRLGHEVVVLTGKPNYPGGTVFEGYSAEGIQHERYAGTIEVVRVPLRPRGSGSSRGLFLNYLSFAWSGLRYFPRLIKEKKADVILVYIPSPITAAIPGILLKWIKKAHLAIWIQDLWPESLSATGYIKNPLLLKLTEWMVRGIYFFADTLLIQSRAFRHSVGRLADPEKIVYYPNSIDSSLSVQERDFSLPESLIELLQNKFCLVFAGNIGKAQSIETIIQAALLIKEKKDDVTIVMVGSGSMLDWVREQKLVLQLDNLILTGRFPMQAMTEIYQYASGLIVTLKNEEIFSLTIPSKIQAYLASGKPIIAALNGEGAKIVQEADAGLTCAAEDAENLAKCMLALRRMSEKQRAAMGKRGYDYFKENFEMSQQSRRLIEILNGRITTLKGKTG